ncbi:hypothetical protein [Paenibacillus ginsengihumi]|uniref:hypothetical protein n=1 Tax=Paenibacillus ginsengihumi TaxID=431596 RepID=UPI000365F0A7|nr:hypothetical protein [Paenibacillus ginsengihumi]
MKRIIGIAAAAVLLLAGCGHNTQDQQLNMKTLQKTVGKERIMQTLDQLPPPPMNKSIMQQADADIIAWIKRVDEWTHQVLSAPVTGEMDEYAAQEMRNRLRQVYSYDMADQLIAYFYRRDDTTRTYQAFSSRAMLGLRSEWQEYFLRKEQPSPEQYMIQLTGTNNRSVPRLQHRSVYQVSGDNLIITRFETSS